MSPGPGGNVSSRSAEVNDVPVFEQLLRINRQPMARREEEIRDRMASS